MLRIHLYNLLQLPRNIYIRFNLFDSYIITFFGFQYVPSLLGRNIVKNILMSQEAQHLQIPLFNYEYAIITKYTSFIFCLFEITSFELYRYFFIY